MVIYLNFPLGFTDISKLIALLASILIITSVIVNQNYMHANLALNKHRLERAALILGLISLIPIAIIVLDIIMFV